MYNVWHLRLTFGVSTFNYIICYHTQIKNNACELLLSF